MKKVSHVDDQHKARPLEERFTALYDRGGWAGPHHDEPISGAGSSLQRTAELRQELYSVVGRLFKGQQTVRIVDAPCGDMTWMPELLATLALVFERIDYVGVDIVQKLIAKNRGLKPPAVNVELRFEHLDITTAPIPDCDLFFCKDLVNHLCDDDIFCLISNLDRSRCRYAMISSNRGHINRELDSLSPDASRHVDLLAPPFSLPQPLRDHAYLPLWRLPFTKDRHRLP
jgi:hypothetical protein